MDYELHNLIEYAALEAAEPKVASDLYRLHADVAKLPTGSRRDELLTKRINLDWFAWLLVILGIVGATCLLAVCLAAMESAT